MLSNKQLAKEAVTLSIDEELNFPFSLLQQKKWLDLNSGSL